MSATPAFDEIETFLICGQRERSLCGRAGGWVGGVEEGRREGTVFGRLDCCSG